MKGFGIHSSIWTMESFMNMPEDLAWGLSVWRPVADSTEQVIGEGAMFLRAKADQCGLIGGTRTR